MTTRPANPRPVSEALYVSRALQALELLTFQDLSAPQLAASMQIHPRTARRILLRLADDDYIEQTYDQRRRYRATLRVAALAGQLITHHDLPRIAAPHIADLHASTGETTHLYTPAYRDVVCMLHCDHAAAPDAPVEPVVRELLPATATAPGRVLLAHRQRWRDSILRHPLQRFTNRTLTSRRELELDAARIRQRGHAIEDGEHHADTRAIAAPVHSETSTLAAIAITITRQGGNDTIAALVEQVTRTAAALTDDLTTADRLRSQRPR